MDGHGFNQGLWRLSNAGLLLGISDVSQGRGLDVQPYARMAAVAAPGRGDDTFRNDFDVGLDVFYSLTPRLRANFTVNTDFAQTEVDQRQVNLTRFSLFFPEKRDFFLEGRRSSISAPTVRHASAALAAQRTTRLCLSLLAGSG